LSERVFRAYRVWPRFPSVSISGGACGLSCLHCNKAYLSYMTPATTPAELVRLAEDLVKNKTGEGLLVSGGCDREGRMLSLPKFLPALEEIHKMGLIIKLHTGFADEKLARGIAEAGVDIASMEYVGSRDSVREIFGLEASPEDYQATFEHLRDAGVSHIAPHICVGLHRGSLRGEFAALDRLKKIVKPSTIALIAFRPTKGTELEGCAPPTPESVGRVAAHARKLFPSTKIILGALRPRGTGPEAGREARESIEREALRAGISGAEVPSTTMLAEARAAGFKVKKIEAFGVLPEAYESRVKTSWTDG
jgi:hypothetical protein